MSYYLTGRYDDAITIAERVLKRAPDLIYSHVVLAASYAQANNPEGAARSALAVQRLDPFFKVETYGDLFRDPADKEKVAEGLSKAGLE